MTSLSPDSRGETARRACPRVLVTLADTAAPINTGKRLRAAAMLRGLAALTDHLDVLVLFSDHPRGVRPIPDDVSVTRWLVIPGQPAARTASLRAVLRGMPWRIAAWDWAAVRAEVEQFSSADYDLVWFGSLDHLIMLRSLFPGIPHIVDYDDVEPDKIKAFLALAPRGPSGRMQCWQQRVEYIFWRRLERIAIRCSVAIIVCSDLDVERLGSTRAVAIPNTYADPAVKWPEVKRTECKAAPFIFLMLANYAYGPNIDAARFAADRVVPALRRRLPDAVVLLVGRNADERLREFVGVPGVEVCGEVADVGPVLQQATAAIAPIRYGGGTRLKIIEAFAYSVPVISTTLGAEGLGAVDDEHILIADEAEDFATACARVASDTGLRTRLARAGRQLYETRYRPAAASRRVADIVSDVLSSAGIQCTNHSGELAGTDQPTRCPRCGTRLPEI